MKTIYPPEFVQGLEEVFRGLQRDSHVFSVPPHQKDIPDAVTAIKIADALGVSDLRELWGQKMPARAL